MIRSLASNLALNAIVPLLCYLVAKRALHATDFVALVAATLFPLGKSAVDLVRRHELEPFAAMALAGIVTSLVAVCLGGSPRLLLIRESFATAAFGIACMASLAFPRPLMFFFGRYFVAGKSNTQRKAFNDRWIADAAFRHANRVITAVWGLVYSGEFAMIVALVFALPVAVYLAVSPVANGLATIATIAWTVWYVKHLQLGVTPA